MPTGEGSSETATATWNKVWDYGNSDLGEALKVADEQGMDTVAVKTDVLEYFKIQLKKFGMKSSDNKNFPLNIAEAVSKSKTFLCRKILKA